MSSEPTPLPELLDAKQLRAELGVSERAAEKFMHLCPIVAVPGLRKVYVKRDDIAALIDRCTEEHHVRP